MRRARARDPLVVKLVVGCWASWGTGRAALQKLRMALARLAGRPFRRVAANLGLQLDDVEEDVSLSAELVSNHWRLGGDGGDHSDPDAPALHRLDQCAEVAVA